MLAITNHKLLKYMKTITSIAVVCMLALISCGPDTTVDQLQSSKESNRQRAAASREAAAWFEKRAEEDQNEINRKLQSQEQSSATTAAK